MKSVRNAAIAAISLLFAGALTAHAAPMKIDPVRAKAKAHAEAVFSKVAFLRFANPAREDGNDTGASRRTGKVSARSAHDGLIAKYAAAEGVPLALAHAVIRIESNYRAKARGSAGEIGLMQIKPATARGMGFSGPASALYDPATNLRWGMKYLGKAYALGGGDTCGAILKYNAGHGAKRMNKVSAAYCGKVKAQMRRA